MGPLVGFVLLSGVLAAALPLATYATSLALLGWVHVLSELRYVDLRFGPTLSRHLRLSLLVPLALIALERALGGLHVLSGGAWVTLELCLAALSLAGVFWYTRGLGVGRWPAALLACLLIAGVLWRPLHTLLLFAVLHNLTPLGFLAERLAGAERRRALGVGLVCFVGIPLLIALGGVEWIWARVGWQGWGWELWPSGPLAKNLGVYLPAEFHEAPWARQVFSGVVFAQCMHYGAVIHVLPRLVPDAGAGIFAWPSRRAFAGLTAGVAAVMAVGFWWAFADARIFYGLAASVHAWIEWPLLCLAIARGAAPQAQPTA